MKDGGEMDESTTDSKVEAWCPETDLNRRHADFQSEVNHMLSVTFDRAARQTGHGRSTTYGSSVKPAAAATVAELTGAGWPNHWPRPAPLPRPDLVETLTLLPDHPLGWFAWEGMRQQVRRADASERIFRTGGRATPRGWPCATTSQSRTRRANASGSIAGVRTRTRPPAATGSLMGSAALWR